MKGGLELSDVGKELLILPTGDAILNATVGRIDRRAHRHAVQPFRPTQVADSAEEVLTRPKPRHLVQIDTSIRIPLPGVSIKHSNACTHLLSAWK